MRLIVRVADWSPRMLINLIAQRVQNINTRVEKVWLVVKGKKGIMDIHYNFKSLTKKRNIKKKIYGRDGSMAGRQQLFCRCEMQMKVMRRAEGDVKKYAK